MESKLVLAGDRSAEKAKKKYSRIGLKAVGIGLIMFIVCVLMTIFSLLSLRPFMALLMMAGGIVGGLAFVGGLAAPVVGVKQHQKCFVDVYEHYISGTKIVRQKGKAEQYEAFRLLYKDISGASAEKDKVVIHVGATNVECYAFNADDIVKEIMARLSY